MLARHSFIDIHNGVAILDPDGALSATADRRARDYSDAGFLQRRQWRTMPMGGQHFFQRMSIGIAMSR